MWIIKTECNGTTMYAGGIYPAWTEDRDKASIFIDGQDNPELKLGFFNSIVDILCAGAKCEIEVIQ